MEECGWAWLMVHNPLYQPSWPRTGPLCHTLGGHPAISPLPRDISPLWCYSTNSHLTTWLWSRVGRSIIAPLLRINTVLITLECWMLKNTLSLFTWSNLIARSRTEIMLDDVSNDYIESNIVIPSYQLLVRAAVSPSERKTAVHQTTAHDTRSASGPLP